MILADWWLESGPWEDDSFATARELAAAASKVPQATIHQLTGADHGFAVLKSSGRTQQDVWTEAADSMLSWRSQM